MTGAAFPLFVLGASAGGLEPLTEIVRNVKFDTPMALVVAQHLSPTSKSMLVDILNRSANGRVRFAEQHQRIEPGAIYIIPPDTNATISHGHIDLEDAPKEQISPQPSIDRLFTSLAESDQHDKVAIILSGTGSDGTQGMRAIREAGGLLVAQDPLTAKFESMPVTAINTLSIQMVLNAAEIAALINGYPASVATLRDHAASLHATRDADPLKRLQSLLLIRSGIDFTAYRQNTIERRLEKFQADYKIENLEALHVAVERDQRRLEELAESLLIPVTSFFRDQDAFEALERALIDYLHQTAGVPEFRAWIIGCATGQEVYSLLILLQEILAKAQIHRTLRIFATDVSEKSLAVARTGEYPAEDFADMPDAIRERYFRRTDHGFQIRQNYRDLIVFSRHDVLKSPSLTRMDFVCCRNLLIYFTDHHQELVLNGFAAALSRHGVLFLGKSESLKTATPHFKVLDSKWRLFERKADVPATLKLTPSRLSVHEQRAFDPKRNVREQTGETLEHLGRRYLVRQFAPPSVIYDRSWKIHFVYGDLDELLHFREGGVSTELLNLLPEELRTSIVHLTNATQREGQPASMVQAVYVAGLRRKYRTWVVDLAKMGRSGFFMASFEPQGSAALAVEGAADNVEVESTASDAGQRDAVFLERELQDTREYLQTVVEELETSNEELQSLNEELQAANEELQSTNEELESTNEELQASNEEMDNVNAELQKKSQLLELTASHLESVQNSTGHPVVVVNRDLEMITRNRSFDTFFPYFKLRNISNMLEGGFGEAFAVQIRSHQDDVWSGMPYEFESRLNQQIFSVRLSPFFTSEDAIQGTVISFIDQTELITVRNRLAESESRLSALVNHSPSLISIKDVTGRYLLVNEAFESYFGGHGEQVIGRVDADFLPKSLADRIRAIEFRILQNRAGLTEDEIVPTKRGTRHFLTTRFLIVDGQDHVQGIGMIGVDISESLANRELIDSQKRELEKLTRLATIGQFSASVAHEINNPLAIISGEIQLLEKLVDRSSLDTDRVRSFVQNAGQAVERISATITALRKFTRDFKDIQLGALRLTDVLHEAFLPNEAYFRVNVVRYTCEVAESIQVMGDMAALSLVFANLFRNAIEANKGVVSASVRVTATGMGTGKILVRVADTGMGIPKETQAQILETVYSTKGEENMGLGLKLTRQILSSHGGQLRIDVDSPTTAFIVELAEPPQ